MCKTNTNQIRNQEKFCEFPELRSLLAKIKQKMLKFGEVFRDVVDQLCHSCVSDIITSI